VAYLKCAKGGGAGGLGDGSPTVGPGVKPWYRVWGTLSPDPEAYLLMNA